MKRSMLDDATLLAVFSHGTSRPLHVAEIAQSLGFPLSERHRLSEALEVLAERGLLSQLPGARFRRKRDDGVRLEGRLSQNPRGFAFVSASDGGTDVYVPGNSIAGAMHGDLVVVLAHEGPRGRDGVVLEVLTRRSPRIPCTLRAKGSSRWGEPDDARIRGPIVVEGDGGGRDGDAVIVDITRFPAHPDESPLGTVTEVLGVVGAIDVEVRKVLIREAVEDGFPEEALVYARSFPAEIPADEVARRTDLRTLPLLTIDPDDARDHDDAVHVLQHDDGTWTATIAIADVSYFVREGSALDEAALARCTSIYLPDRAIPMLPYELSSDLASLREGVDRLVMVCEVHLGHGGAVQSSRLFEGVMRSRAKLTYTNVARMMKWSEGPAPQGLPADTVACVEAASELSAILRTRRMKRGALDFDLPEGRVRFGDDGVTPVAIYQSRQDPGVRRAYGVVEEMMLLANEVVAQTLVEADLPAIYRVHGAPDDEHLARFTTVARAYGHLLEDDEARTPKKLSAFLRKLSGRPEARVLHMILLRAMQQARYSAQNAGHFGLASEAYLHFTSPIRRYPDIVVHRAVKALIHKSPTARDEKAVARNARAAAESSRLERRAMDVEREALDLYRCVIAKRHLGEVHESVVTGVSAAGPYCEIESPFLTGLLRHDEVGPEGWELDELGVRISLGRSGFGYSLGDAVTVEISEVSIPRRTVYLALPPEVRERHAASRGKVRIVKSAKPAKGAKPTKGAKPAKAKGRKGR
jgi:ribonuclease R